MILAILVACAGWASTSLGQPMLATKPGESPPLAQRFLQYHDRLGLTPEQTERLEILLDRWRATRDALSKRVQDHGIAAARDKADAMLIWQELGRQRVLVDREALLLLSDDQRQRWKHLTTASSGRRLQMPTIQ